MEENIYNQYSIHKLIFTFSFPAIISLIIETMTSVVDTSFAGHLGAQSESALSAMGMLSPVFAVFVALQTLFAVSTAIMISKFLGQGNRVALSQYFKIGFVMTVVISVGTSLFTFFVMNPLLSVLGATDEVYTLAFNYLKIILVSNVFSSIGYTLTSCIRAFGHPTAEAVIISLSVLLNIMFNAILTFGFQLGMTGIALGTLISELVCAFISWMYLVKNQLWFKSRKLSLKEQIQMSVKMLKIGFAQTTIQILAGMTGFIINHQLLVTGGQSHIAVWNMANRLYMLGLMPIIGMTQGIQTIIAYFDGKKEEGKKKHTVKITILSCFVYGIGITGIVFLFGESVLRLFTSNGAMLASAMAVVQVIFVTFPLLGITYTVMTLLQVTGKEVQAVILALIRQVIAVVPFVLVLPYIFGKVEMLHISPSFSIFFAIPIADILTLGAAFGAYGHHSKLSNKIK